MDKVIFDSSLELGVLSLSLYHNIPEEVRIYSNGKWLLLLMNDARAKEI
jgi:hypothetical protein